MSYAERGDPGSGDGFEDTDYARVGIAPDVARGWRRWGIEPIDAARWLKAGVDDEVEAARWGKAVQPSDVADFRTAGMTSELLARWREHGADAQQALHELSLGRKPEDYQSTTRHSSLQTHMRGMARHRGGRAKAISDGTPLPDPDEPDIGSQAMGVFGSHFAAYIGIGWYDSEAKTWAAQDIDALDARDWKRLGLTPVEAARCERQGVGATDVALTWWRAGFAPEEVADWLGAGLTPEEAAAQKADGVTLEQAAVLRSLRRHESE